MAKLSEAIYKHKSLIKWSVIALIFCCVFPACWKNQTRKPIIFENVEDTDEYLIRVLLFNNIKECDLTSSGGFSVRGSGMELLAHFGEDGKPIKAAAEDGSISCGGPSFADNLIIVPDKRSLLSVNGRPYRGNLKLSVSKDGQSLTV
ncbi:MAG: hypothetical protein KAI59_00370, partial [Planctomycetes bacterium]|nr:hypothetical protein [Planctomycetota bacterium]